VGKSINENVKISLIIKKITNVLPHTIFPFRGSFFVRKKRIEIMRIKIISNPEVKNMEFKIPPLVDRNWFIGS